MVLKVNIGSELLAKLNILSSDYDIEIGGYITAEIKDDGIYLKDILIPDQAISKVSVEITPKDQINLLKKYGPEKCKDIKFHWHSHNSLGVFFSGTDINNMQRIMQYKDFFGFIVSSMGTHLIKIYQKKPFPYEYNKIILNVKTVSIDLMRKQVAKILSENNYTYKPIEVKQDDSEDYDNNTLNEPEDELDHAEDVEDLNDEYND